MYRGPGPDVPEGARKDPLWGREFTKQERALSGVEEKPSVQNKSQAQVALMLRFGLGLPVVFLLVISRSGKGKTFLWVITTSTFRECNRQDIERKLNVQKSDKVTGKPTARNG